MLLAIGSELATYAEGRKRNNSLELVSQDYELMIDESRGLGITC